MATERDMLSRLHLMADHDPKWDLSDNDCAAIKYALTELAELRAKLAAAEEEKSSLRASVICAMNDIQHGLPATGHAKLTLLLDGIMRSPGNLAERLQAQLSAATERADRLKARAERAEHISDECANQNAALRAALGKIAGPPIEPDLDGLIKDATCT